MKTLRTTFLITGILMMFSTNIANAAFLNLGTLDVRPLNAGDNPEWLVEYADRGESLVRYIQIANFSPEKKEVELYTTDSSKKLGLNFVAQTKEENSQKIAGWMRMPTTSLVLNSGETKIVPVKITVPQNAGVGLHNAAIIVREKNKAEGTEFFVEKGVRVYLNVKGGILDKSQVSSGQLTQSLENTGLSMVIENRGTVDFDTDVIFELQNLGGETVARQKLEAFARPGEKTSMNFETTKPSFGIFQAILRTGQSLNGETNFNAGIVVIVPLWGLLLLAALAMAPGFSPSFTREKIRSLNLKNTRLQKGLSFFGILLISGLISTPLMNLGGTQNFFTAVFETGNPENYEVTVKWGDLRHLVLDKRSKMDWHGQITFSDATVTIKRTLNLEANDAINIVDNMALNFSLTTDTTNDGVVLSVTPTGDASPKLTFENYSSNTKRTIDLKRIHQGRVLIPNQSFAASIEVEEITAEELHGAPLLTEEGATPEAQATPEVRINIPELKGIFDDIPATPEVLSEFILTSDYVKKITTENALTQIETESVLIRALEATPEIIAEITATPNLNFTFIPSETITFPAQPFSFDQDKTSTQNLGTIIFVQNKETPWNTYIGTTNFISLSGRGIIPAGSLTVLPGDAKVLKQEDGTTVNEGTEKNIQGIFDKSILVNVQPGFSNTDSKTIFTMNPRLQIKVPHGTLPGKYRGLLTLTSL